MEELPVLKRCYIKWRAWILDYLGQHCFYIDIAVVGIADKTVISPAQFHVQLVEDKIG